MGSRGCNDVLAGHAGTRLTRALYGLARRWDSAGLRLLDASAIGGAWLIAGLAGFDERAQAAAFHNLLWFVGLPVVFSLTVNQVAGLYGPVWRYASVDEAGRVVVAVAVGTSLSTAAAAAVASSQDVAVSWLVTAPIAALFALLGVGGIRFQSRFFALQRQRSRPTGSSTGGRVLIVGAGDAGVSLAYELRHRHSDAMHIVGFVDDEPRLAGRSIRGIPILGRSSDLAALCRAHDIDTILVALADTPERKVVLDRALAADAQVKVLPPATERVAGPALRNLRDLDVTDVLGRPHAPVDSDEIATYLSGATVLITGAGGSIGSEIARQVATYGPQRLVLLDREETLLHDVILEALPGAEAVLADITDRERIGRVFADYRPDVVFHAAAQKQVPLLQKHPVEAVRTNVIGTWIIASAAAEHGCSRFVHISTDKAAAPSSVLGATKRIAEQIVFELGRRHDRRFVAVRFGNVLGTRGSVVPTFLRQILDGGPVTVTSADTTRFFMTVQEAVSLVLEAGAIASERTVFLLDMGEPVPILSLARQMIRLAGLRPDRDIAISFVGLRPGERLHEQLYDDSEIVEPAAHPSLSVLVPRNSLAWRGLEDDMADLTASSERCDDAAAVEMIEQLLVERGVPCQIQPCGHRDAEPVLFDLTAFESVNLVPANGARSLALLGGTARFPEQVPFARPARPPLEQVTRRFSSAYESGILTNGALVRELEERVAERLDVRHVVAVSSCTSGLILALQGLLDGRAGPVVVPSFTFAATGLAVVWNGRRLRLVDCEPATFQVSLEAAVDALDGASALIATHVFGAPCRPAAVEQLARTAGVPVLFDAAHAFGARTRGEPVGRFGDAEVFSLTPTKVLVAGEGGLVATRDGALADRLRVARNYGNEGNYNTAFPGLNARLSEFHAAMALESLDRLDATLRRRRQLAALYRRCFDGVPGLTCQSMPLDDESTFKDFTVRIDADEFGIDRDALAAVLAAEGVETRNYFDPPLHAQTAFSHAEWVDLSTTEQTAQSVISLPIYPDLAVSTVDQIVDVVRAAHDHADQIVDRDGLLVAAGRARLALLTDRGDP